MNKLWIAFGLGMGISSAAWADVTGDQLYVALDGGNASYRDFCTGTFALNDTFALLGKLGIVQSDTNFDLLTPGAAASTSVSTARTTLGYGLGGQFNFDRHTGLRVQYEHLGNFGDATTIITSTVRLVSAGFIYHF